MKRWNMKERYLTLMVGLTVLGLAAAASHADVITYQQGQSNALVSNYQGTQDNMLASASNRVRDNFGKYQSAMLGHVDWSNAAREIMRFDLSSLAGRYIDINSVTLTLSFWWAYPGDKGGTLNVHKILPANSDWVEGIGAGGPSPDIRDGESCWRYKAWSELGAHAEWAGGFDSGCGVPDVDYDSTALASYAWKGRDLTKGYEIELILTGTDLKAMIDSWAGPQEDNAGLLLLSEPESGQNLLQYSNPDSAAPPKLTVDYVVPEPATLSLVLLGVMGVAYRGRKSR